MTDVADIAPDRPLKTALARGFRRRCPNCGQGRAFQGYLKVAERCDHCDYALGAHRADDGPPYVTILLVGHIQAPVLHHIYANYDEPNPWVVFAVLATTATLASLYLLPRIKGAIIGFQWSRGNGPS